MSTFRFNELENKGLIFARKNLIILSQNFGTFLLFNSKSNNCLKSFTLDIEKEMGEEGVEDHLGQ